MNEEQERLSRDLSHAGADWLIENHYMHLPVARRIKLHCRFRDAIYAAVLSYHEVSGAMRIRAIAMASEN